MFDKLLHAKSLYFKKHVHMDAEYLIVPEIELKPSKSLLCCCSWAVRYIKMENI